MIRRRALVIVILAGFVAGVVAQVVDPGGPARAFCLFAAALIVGITVSAALGITAGPLTDLFTTAAGQVGVAR